MTTIKFTINFDKTYANFLCILLWLVCAVVSLPAFAEDSVFKTLTQDDWQIVTQSKGVMKEGESKSYIQIIFDVNCPHSAKLFTWLADRHPNTPIRWVPIAYFRKDSAALASSILSSKAPYLALTDSFAQYDFEHQRSSYQNNGDSGVTKSINSSLKTRWLEWIGATPLIIVNTQKNEILMHAGSRDKKAIQQIIELAGGLKGY